LSWLAGNLSILSPCVLPLLPMVLGGVATSHRLGPVAMGAGMAVSFSVLGVVLGALGPLLGLDSGHVRTMGAVVLMVLGGLVWLPSSSERFTQWMTPMASRANAWAARLHSDSLGGAFLLGALLGLVWSPCSGPLLASALIMAASESDAGSGAVMLGFFGLGAATPLVAAAYVSRPFFGAVRQRVASWGEWFKKLLGIAIFASGLAVASGADKWLEALVLPLLPEGWLKAVTLF
jgi:cytochrome c-type biogenesis protein